ncbi:MAG TPA: adenylate/guanylate cyclase domain-containing protein [Treponemataceae bacterium]|nr:adenylate/guanylate cyclase domain-containing protein [Treponemataceae bacterium]
MENLKSDAAEKVIDPELIKKIEEFYLPRHLVKAIYDIGDIPASSQETQVGVGFIDIADYTRLSRYLSPKENQILLNGLYTAFQIVLVRHGGFLNKIEGDSMMFQFDDILDKKLWDKDRKERIAIVARELFYTCVEMQRVCILFNQAHDDFLEQYATPEAKQCLDEAFKIITQLRCKDDISSTLFAFFQIRIRIGANIGEVTIGNFGPEGAKQWDVIGMPVINAKRMESTAPIGGLRISDEFYQILEENGITEDYWIHFRKEAERMHSVYRDIERDELFKFREVVIHEKHGAIYRTYSVQVYPGLPESLSRQTMALLNHGEKGVAEIVEFFRYYRANHFIIDELERMLAAQGVVFRKQEIIDLIFSKLNKSTKPKRELSLFKIFSYMDRYLDFVQKKPESQDFPDFISYGQYTATLREQFIENFETQKRIQLQRSWFIGVVVPLAYASLEASLLEFQHRSEELEEAEELLDE